MDAIAEYVKSQYDQSDRNRRDLNNKWENNRADFCGNLMGSNGSGTSSAGTNKQFKAKEAEGWRSDTFPSATHQKVIGALCIVLDTLLAGGSIPFMLKPSPYNKYRYRQGGQVDAKLIEQDINFMTDLIDQQFADCKAENHLSKNCLSAALYGETYAKLSIREIKRQGWEREEMQPMGGVTDWSRLKDVPTRWKRWSEQFNSPHWIYVPVWDIFRDWEDDDLIRCAYIMQRQITNNWYIKSKMGKPFFIDDNITAAIKAAPAKNDRSASNVSGNEDTSNMTPIKRDFIQYRTNNRQYIEYWGRFPRKVVEEFEKNLNEENRSYTSMLLEDNDDGDEVEACAHVVQGEFTIRFAKTVPEMRPFCRAAWEDVVDEFMPRGVADNCSDMQNVIKGTLRGIEDNVKMAGNVILAIKERLLKTVPDEIVPGAKLILAEECQRASDAIQQVQVNDMTAGLSGLWNIAKEQMEEDSMVPRIAQGMPDQGGQTAREASIRQAQALKYIGMAIRNLDNGVIEPMVQKFYEYNMEDPSIDQGKGNYIIQALGFSSFQNRTDRLTKLQQSLMMALQSPDLNKITKIAEFWAEIQKSLDIDPDQFLKSDEEMAQEAANAQNDPNIQLQQEAVQADVDKKKADAAKSKADAAKSLADAESKSTDNHAKNIVLDKELQSFEEGSPAPFLAGGEGQAQPGAVEQGSPAAVGV